MNISIDHPCICVSDMEKAIAFYRDVVGLKVLAQVDMDERVDTIEKVRKMIKIPNARYKLAMIGTELGAPMIELMQFLSPTDGKPLPPDHRICNIGISHIAFHVKDIEETYKEMVAKGVEFTAPPETFILKGFPPAKGTYFRDPDGNYLELVEF